MTEVIGVAAADLLPGDKIQLDGRHERISRKPGVQKTPNGQVLFRTMYGPEYRVAETDTFRVDNDLDPHCLAKHTWAYCGQEGVSWDRSTVARREILTKEATVERLEVTYVAPTYGDYSPAWILDAYHSDETRAEWTGGPSELAYDEREALQMIFSWLGTI